MIDDEIDKNISKLRKEYKQLNNYLRSTYRPNDHSPSYHFQDRDGCSRKISAWQDVKKMQHLYQELQKSIQTDVEKELVDDIWYDVEATLPWGTREKLRRSRLASNIAQAMNIEHIAKSKFMIAIQDLHI